MARITAEQKAALQHAKSMAEAGVPIFVARPADDGDPSNTGFKLPRGWQRTEADPAAVDAWKPGYALCAVMGHVVDTLDIDPRSGGSEARLGKITPTVYGKARTRGGGSHLLISSLGLPSRDGILPGVDYKAGFNGSGHGFVFIAPTERPGPDGQPVAYRWEQEPNLESLSLIGPDGSGAALREHIRNLRSGSGQTAGYDGPEYAQLTPERQRWADQLRDDSLYDWKVALGAASGWPEGYRDERGRGWEALTRDAAWSLAKMSACPWIDFDPDAAERAYEALLPEVMARDPKCRGKWYPGLVEKVQAQTADLPPWWSEDFFESTEVLRHIRDVAWSRLVSSGGLLSVILARVLFEVDPSVCLPPIVGAPASLNLGVALAGSTGAGKSSIISTSRDVLGLVGLSQETYENAMGSGEGMADLFLVPGTKLDGNGQERPDPSNPVLSDDPRAIIITDEVQSMGAQQQRRGSTTGATLRTCLTGGMLGSANSRAGGRFRRVPAMRYRAIVVVGAQPQHSGVLLSAEETAAGTPQRFLWADLHGEKIPDVVPPLAKVSLDWELPRDLPERVVYPEWIADEIREQQRQQLALGLLDNTGDVLDAGHAKLVQLKVAFALAILHGETEITGRWWRLAASMMHNSMAVQAKCREVIGMATVARMESEANHRAEAQASATGTRLERAAQALLRKLEDYTGPVVWSKVRPRYKLIAGLETIEVLEEAQRMQPRLRFEAEEQTGGQINYTLELPGA